MREVGITRETVEQLLEKDRRINSKHNDQLILVLANKILAEILTLMKSEKYFGHCTFANVVFSKNQFIVNYSEYPNSQQNMT